MKQSILAILACICAGAAFADTASVTVTAAGADAYSSAIPASGYIEKVEIVKSSDNDAVTFVLATYSGTTALDTIVSDTLATGTDTKVYKPRSVGTGTSGTALAAVVAGTSTNATQVLTVPYERFLAGGNLKAKIGASAGTNATINVTVYYAPMRK
jgi:hypothetical protein